MLIKLIIGALLCFFVWRTYRYFTAPARKIMPEPLKKKKVRGTDLVEDPICHTYLPQDSAYEKVLDGEGKPVYFCSAACFNEYMKRTKQEES
jgi:YHS domain-containing protein